MKNELLQELQNSMSQTMMEKGEAASSNKDLTNKILTLQTDLKVATARASQVAGLETQLATQVASVSQLQVSPHLWP